MKNIIIGGGIHGLTVAIALSNLNKNVIVLEKRDKLFKGTSGSTHNRAHMGYHYPKSIETAKECLKGLEYFKKRFPKALVYPKKGFYIVEKSSQTSQYEYMDFCNCIKIPGELKWPEKEFIKKDNLAASFIVREPIFNTELLCELLEQEATSNGVVIKKGSDVVESRKLKDGSFEIITNKNDKIKKYNANVVINATYACANNILNIFGMKHKLTKYVLQTTEVAVVKSQLEIPPLTIMDGPFMSIMPYSGHKNSYLVYDVENSVINEEVGYYYDDSIKFKSNWSKMVNKGKKYFPFMEELLYLHSLYGSRPIPVDGKIQSRKTRIMKSVSNPGFYTLLEGKFISAPLMADKLVDLLKEDGFIK